MDSRESTNSCAVCCASLGQETTFDDVASEQREGVIYVVFRPRSESATTTQKGPTDVRRFVTRLPFAILLALAAFAYGAAVPGESQAASAANIISYEHSNLTGSTRPYTITCSYGGQLYCTAVPNLGNISGPCKPYPWSGSTWNDCISSVYFQNYTSAYLLVIYHTNANYGGSLWRYCVRPQTTWSGNVLSIYNDSFSSLSANFYSDNPGGYQGNC